MWAWYYQTCQPKTDNVGIFQASLVVEDDWKIPTKSIWGGKVGKLQAERSKKVEFYGANVKIVINTNCTNI